MEELLVYALLLCEGLETENSYKTRLDELFLENPEDDTLLHLEWETDIKNAVIYIRSNFHYSSFDHKLFGKILMNKLGDCYYRCQNIREFGDRMFSLWENLPGIIQDEEPFHTLSYADDPLSYGDEKQSRELYENMLCYYKNECLPKEQEREHQ